MLIPVKVTLEAEKKSEPAPGSIYSSNIFTGKGKHGRFPHGWYLLNLKVKITFFSFTGVHRFCIVCQDNFIKDPEMTNVPAADCS